MSKKYLLSESLIFVIPEEVLTGKLLYKDATILGKSFGYGGKISSGPQLNLGIAVLSMACTINELDKRRNRMTYFE